MVIVHVFRFLAVDVVILQIHGETIASNPALAAALEKLEKLQSATWHELQSSFNQSVSMISYLKSATV